MYIYSCSYEYCTPLAYELAMVFPRGQSGRFGQSGKLFRSGGGPDARERLARSSPRQSGPIAFTFGFGMVRCGSRG